VICSHCSEQLVATPAALRGFAHDHGMADHDADPIEVCAVCGGSGRIEITNHGLACRVRGCGREAGCVLVSVVCQVCERKELGDDLAWSASDRMAPVSLLDRAWTWLAEAVVPGEALRISVAGQGRASAPLSGLRSKLQRWNYIGVIGSP
jgi:hypothetical protein